MFWGLRAAALHGVGHIFGFLHLKGRHVQQEIMDILLGWFSAVFTNSISRIQLGLLQDLWSTT